METLLNPYNILNPNPLIILKSEVACLTYRLRDR